MRRDAHVKTFVKWEKTNITAKPNFVPRVIQPRSPRFNVELGKFLAKVEKQMMSAIDSTFGYPVVMSGYNASQQGQIFYESWNSFSDPVAIGLDAKRFDQHVSTTALQWEHERWLPWFTGNDRKYLEKLLRMQLTNHGTGRTKDGRIKYHVDGKRMSGDMNTSSGNKLLMCGMLYSYLKKRNITKHRVLNNGDDCMVIVERYQYRQFINGINHWFERMGFDMQVEKPVFRLEELEFCQSRPVFDGNSWRMVRNYPLALDKDSNCFIQSPTMRTTKRWMAGVGKAGLSLTGGIPIAQELYMAYVRNSKDYTPTKLDPNIGLARLSFGMSERYRQITPQCRASFYAAFGITPDVQIICEKTFRAWHLESNQNHRLKTGVLSSGLGRLLELARCPELGPNRHCPGAEVMLT